jgi:hypothetical protein
MPLAVIAATAAAIAIVDDRVVMSVSVGEELGSARRQ